MNDEIEIIITRLSKTNFIIDTPDDGIIPVYFIPNVTPPDTISNHVPFSICYDRKIIHCSILNEHLTIINQFDIEQRKRMFSFLIEKALIKNARRVIFDPNDLHVIRVIDNDGNACDR